MDEKGLKKLREPFPAHQILKLPKPYKKDAPKGNCKECGGYHGLPAAHLDYVGHAALTDRLLDADPAWGWEPLATINGLPAFDESGGLWIRLTVCGVTRLGYGNAEAKTYMDVGARTKEVIGDALRNAAMRFGCALDLWHKGDLHINMASFRSVPRMAMDEQDPVERERLILIGNTCLDLYKAGDPVAALDTYDNVKDAEQRTAIWSMFDSKMRSALKKIGAARRASAQADATNTSAAIQGA